MAILSHFFGPADAAGYQAVVIRAAVMDEKTSAKGLSSMSPILLLHAFSTWTMTGLIWFVQLVHYPLFPYAAIGRFTEFAAAHQRRTGWVVGPLMLTEAATATLLVLSAPSSSTAWLGWGLLASIWLSTALIQVPLHRRLATGFDSRAAKRLVATNWWRTCAWTVRAVIAWRLLAAAAS